MLFDQKAADQAVDARFIGRDADHALPPSDFLVQALDAVRCSEPLAIGFRQAEHGRDIHKRFIQEPSGFRGEGFELGKEQVATPGTLPRDPVVIRPWNKA